MRENKTSWKTIRIPAGVSFETFLNENPDLAATAKVYENHHTMTMHAVVYTNLSIIALEKRMSELGNKCGTGR